jgi:hypothetical protein
MLSSCVGRSGKAFLDQKKEVPPRKEWTREDVLLTVDCKEPTFERSVTVPSGSSWFIIENQTDKSDEVHLQCFER